MMAPLPLRMWVRSLFVLAGFVGLLFACSGNLETGGYLNLTLQCREDANCLTFGPNLVCQNNQCTCPSPFTECPPNCISGRQGGTNCICIQLDRSLNNCGACGVRCPPGQQCCNGACINPKSDLKHCGACGQACGAKETCCQGLCCASGESCCNDRCVSTQIDPRHCGACNQTCSTGTCCKGRCCGDQQQCCTNGCVNILGDTNNCGQCGKRCEDGSECCDGDCVEVDEYAKNCGRCGLSCGTFTCCDGQCCNANANTCCGDECANLQTSTKNCGACGNACERGELCCDGVCTDPDESSQHCGRCGNSCGDTSASKTISLPITRDGEKNIQFAFTSLREPNTAESLQLKVDIYGDFNNQEEKATIRIGTQMLGTVGGGEPQCNENLTPAHSTTITLPKSTIRGGKLTVVIDLDDSVSASICRTSKPKANIPRIDVTVLYGAATCCSGQCMDLRTNLDHCGTCNRSCQAGERCCLGNCCQNNESCSTNACILFYPLASSAGRGVAYSPNQSFLAGASGNFVRLWGLQNVVSTVRTLTHTNTVTRLAFSPDSNTLATSDLSGSVSVWNVANGKRIRHLSLNAPAMAVAYQSDGKRLLTGDSKGGIKLWDTTTWTSQDIALHTKSIHHLAFLSNSREALSASLDDRLLVWEVNSRKVLHTLSHPTLLPWDFAVSPDQKTLAVLWSNAGQIVHVIRLYNTTTFNLLTEYITFAVGTRIHRLAWSADSKNLAWSENLNSNNGIHVWDVTINSTTYMLQDTSVSQAVFGVAFHPTQVGQVASSHSDGNVRRWRVNNKLANP